MVEPGRDFNYPTSSGNAPAGFMGATISVNGFHISLALILVVLALVIVYNTAKRRRR